MRKSSHRQGPMLAALMAALTLTACAQLEIADRAVDYNLAVEDATNRMLLLNAVRASKRYPMHFTAIEKISTTTPPKGTAAFTIPFGGDAKSAFTFSPQFTVSSGTTFDLGVLNKELFIQGITTPISMGTFHHYLDQGWPRELLFLMFVRKFEFGPYEFVNIIKSFNNICGPKNKNKPEDCEKFSDLVKSSGLASNLESRHKCVPPPVPNDRKFVNDPAGDNDSFCRFLKFQRLIRMLMALNLRIDTVDKTKGNPKLTERTTSINKPVLTTEITEVTDAQGRKVTTVKKVIPDPSGTTTTEKHVFKEVFKYDKCIKIDKLGVCCMKLDKSRLCPPKKPTEPTEPTKPTKAVKPPSGRIGVHHGAHHVAHDGAHNGAHDGAHEGAHRGAEKDEEANSFPRSPEAMVFYMGELIDTQIGSGDTFIPEIRQRGIDPKSGKPSWEEVSLFRVRTGGSGGAAAVSVAHEGQTYYIPRDKDKRGRSMHVLSLISQIFGRHQSSKELTGTASVRVIGD